MGVSFKVAKYPSCLNGEEKKLLDSLVETLDVRVDDETFFVRNRDPRVTTRTCNALIRKIMNNYLDGNTQKYDPDETVEVTLGNSDKVSCLMFIDGSLPEGCTVFPVIIFDK